LVPTPVPGLAEGAGDIPRVRAELGLFIGVVTALRFNGVSSGFSVNQNTSGAIGGIDAAVRLGLGLEGVDAEFEFIQRLYSDFELDNQTFIGEKDMKYDLLTIKLSDGSKKGIYFDITNFYGREDE